MRTQENDNSSVTPLLSIVVPAYNEAKRISPTLQSIIEFVEHQRIHAEVLVVDDGSTDNTHAIVREFECRCPFVRQIKFPSNMGKGAAVRSGMLKSCGQFVLFTDADGASPIGEVAKLLEKVTAGFDVAIGSRVSVSGSTHVEKIWYRHIFAKTFSFMVRLTIFPNIRDTQCGFKIFTREACDAIFQRQQLNGFAFDLEVLQLAKVLGFKIAEVPINWYDVEGSKVNLVTDTAKMLLDIIRIKRLYPE